MLLHLHIFNTLNNLSGLVNGCSNRDNRDDNNTTGIVIILISKPDAATEQLENVEWGQHLKNNKYKTSDVENVKQETTPEKQQNIQHVM